jgi:hypothetical protein
MALIRERWRELLDYQMNACEPRSPVTLGDTEMEIETYPFSQSDGIERDTLDSMNAGGVRTAERLRQAY